ncbi:MAG: hypothetical protein GXP49_10915 [Deltaproteobacteria bacterium]|nr:hypothetical protein [Deltaproteobacteria bacterium]
MIRLCAKAGFPEPSITELGLRTRFIFPLSEEIVIEEQPRLTGSVTAPVNEYVKRLLLLLQDKETGNAEIFAGLWPEKSPPAPGNIYPSGNEGRTHRVHHSRKTEKPVAEIQADGKRQKVLLELQLQKGRRGQ